MVGGGVARWHSHRAHRQTTAGLGTRTGNGREHAGRGKHRRTADRSRLVARQQVARVQLARSQYEPGGAAVADHRRRTHRGFDRSLRQLQTAVERRRKVSLLPLRPHLRILDEQPVGPARARAILRRNWPHLPARAEGRCPIAVSTARRIAPECESSGEREGDRRERDTNH